MFRSRLSLSALALLAAQLAHGQVVDSGAARYVGERVRVGVARQYVADRIVVGARRIDTVDEVVRDDGSTVTVLGPHGRRIRYPGRGALIAGRLTGLHADWLALDLDDGGPEVRVPRAAIERFEVSLGKPDRARSFLRGAILPGLPLGVASFFFLAFDLDCESDCGPHRNAYIGAAIGVAIGGGLRIALDSERWAKVSVTVGVEPRPGHGVSGAVSLRF